MGRGGGREGSREEEKVEGGKGGERDRVQKSGKCLRLSASVLVTHSLILLSPDGGWGPSSAELVLEISSLWLIWGVWHVVSTGNGRHEYG